jgi:hypothetical protein
MLTLAAGGGAMFPSLSAGQWYRITVIQWQKAYSPSATIVNYTIYRATAVSGDTLTIAGPIEGTTDRNNALGDVVEVRVTAGTIGDLQGAVGALEAAAITTTFSRVRFRAHLDLAGDPERRHGRVGQHGGGVPGGGKPDVR